MLAVAVEHKRMGVYMQSEGLRWLVVETEHGEETIAEQSCAEYGFPTFLPLQRLKDGALAWMYPGYLFVRANPYTDAHWEPLVRKIGEDGRPYMRGVVDVLRNAGSASPWCMPVQHWEVLRTITSPYGVFDPWPRKKRQVHGYRPGDVVRIVRGVFADPHGTMERWGTIEWTDKDTVALTGSCFNGSGTVRVPADQVELLSPEARGDRLTGSGPQVDAHRNRRGGMVRA